MAVTDPSEVMRTLWLRNRDVTVGRIDRVATALTQLAGGTLADQDREEARADAHRLRGILGTYGFSEGSVLAGEAEDLLAGEAEGTDAAALGARIDAYAATL